jgi:hypothetical protein
LVVSTHQAPIRRRARFDDEEDDDEDEEVEEDDKSVEETEETGEKQQKRKRNSQVSQATKDQLVSDQNEEVAKDWKFDKKIIQDSVEKLNTEKGFQEAMRKLFKSGAPFPGVSSSTFKYYNLSIVVSFT